mmetsp:Transcript_133774/g.333890  ORF Transcript_133774/g.333890 Transcript_133774/m.333890 type:complete len:271 (+) Transcript_133774:660-1472(+)
MTGNSMDSLKATGAQAPHPWTVVEASWPPYLSFTTQRSMGRPSTSSKLSTVALHIEPLAVGEGTVKELVLVTKELLRAKDIIWGDGGAKDMVWGRTCCTGCICAMGRTAATGDGGTGGACGEATSTGTCTSAALGLLSAAVAAASTRTAVAAADGCTADGGACGTSTGIAACVSAAYTAGATTVIEGSVLTAGATTVVCGWAMPMSTLSFPLTSFVPSLTIGRSKQPAVMGMTALPRRQSCSGLPTSSTMKEKSAPAITGNSMDSFQTAH